MENLLGTLGFSLTFGYEDAILIEKMNYPQGKKFALTIIDDTDGSTIENVRPVYQFLLRLGMRTTKTIWIFPSKDHFRGISLKNYRYRQFINKLHRFGFEIGLHSVGSGKFTRQDTLDGLEIFRDFLGSYPQIQVNHGQNPDSLYWGIKRFNLFRAFWRFSHFQGDNPESAYFWGDYHKRYIKYTRNFTFRKLNTVMPYEDPQKPFANYWFSAADGADVKKFIRLTQPQNINRLEKVGGAAIIYTHFASGFVKGGRLNLEFQRNLTYISQKNGFFVPVGELLNYLLQAKIQKTVAPGAIRRLEFRWLKDKMIEKLPWIR